MADGCVASKEIDLVAGTLVRLEDEMMLVLNRDDSDDEVFLSPFDGPWDSVKEIS
jgi:hypothetical protein